LVFSIVQLVKIPSLSEVHFMRRVLSGLLILMMLITLGALAEDKDISFLDLTGGIPTQSVTPDPSATPGPSPTQDSAGAQPTPTVVPSQDGSVLLTMSFTGDVTIGGDVRKGGKSIFEKELDKQKDDLSFPFRNVKDIFAQDDMTLVNFEGTLTTAPVNPDKTENSFLFSAPPEYVQILTSGNIEAVSLENNHVMDHGSAGYSQTQDTLRNAGIVYSGGGQIGVYEAKGVKIAMLAYQTFDQYAALFEQVPKDVAAAKAQYPIVIVSFHWGNELDYKPNDNQQKMAKMVIDAGADLVIGHHSHRINPIEIYKGKYICYSLGNFSFAGNTKPSDMSTYIFQTRFRVSNGAAVPEGFRIIPCRISSRTDYNDFAPTPYNNDNSIQSLLNVLKDNGKALENPVPSYPLEWE
jgi:poly-gamma-glutamate synthesis protein (capsule biosynthesis protein)